MEILELLPVTIPDETYSVIYIPTRKEQAGTPSTRPPAAGGLSGAQK